MLTENENEVIQISFQYNYQIPIWFSRHFNLGDVVDYFVLPID